MAANESILGRVYSAVYYAQLAIRPQRHSMTVDDPIRPTRVIDALSDNDNVTFTNLRQLSGDLPDWELELDESHDLPKLIAHPK